jgi:hypothetical protein
MVVDHVHHHPQAHLIEHLDHLAVLDDPGSPVRVGAVGALRNGIVEGIVAPVEGSWSRSAPIKACCSSESGG